MRAVASHGLRRKHPAQQPLWNFLNGLLVLLIFLALGATFYFLFQPELNKLSDMRRRVAELQAAEERTTIEQLRLEREKRLLQSEPEYLENIARDKLDLMKPGETIFRLDSRTAPAPISPAQ